MHLRGCISQVKSVGMVCLKQNELDEYVVDPTWDTRELLASIVFHEAPFLEMWAVRVKKGEKVCGFVTIFETTQSFWSRAVATSVFVVRVKRASVPRPCVKLCRRHL